MKSQTNAVIAEDRLEFHMKGSGRYDVYEDTYGCFKDLNSGRWSLIFHKSYPETEEERDEAVERAKARIGEREYSLFMNNCENFVTQCLTESSISRQVLKGAAATAIGLYKLFTGKRNTV